MIKLIKILLFLCSCIPLYCQNIDLENSLLVKAKAKYTAFVRAGFNLYDSYGSEFYVEEILDGKIDSLTYENTISVGCKIYKGESVPIISKDSVYYIFLKNNPVSYNPVAKIKGDMDTIDDPWIAEKEIVGTIPSYFTNDINKTFFRVKERNYSLVGINDKEISLSVVNENTILLVEFDAMKIKDKISVLNNDNVLYSSNSFISDLSKFVIKLGSIKDGIKIRIENQEKKSSWKIKYRVVELLPMYK